jgi:hypothetical protein
VTTREQIAAMAMQGLLSNLKDAARIANALPEGETFIQRLSEMAVAHADALIAELEALEDDDLSAHPEFP